MDLNILEISIVGERFRLSISGKYEELQHIVEIGKVVDELKILKFQYQNIPVKVALDRCLDININNEELTATYLCHSLISQEKQIPQSYLFVIPNLYDIDHPCGESIRGHGILEHSPISFNNRNWIIRSAYIDPDDNLPKPAKILYDKFILMADEKYLPSKSNRATIQFLEVFAQGEEWEKFEEDAYKICSLLSFIQGLSVRWNQVYEKHEDKIRFIYATNVRKVAQSHEKGLPLILVQHDDTLTKFFNLMSPIYLSNEKWWNLTLSWYISTRDEHTFFKQKILIISILFERVCNYVLNNNEHILNGVKIGDDLDYSLKKNRKQMLNHLTDCIKYFEPLWDKNNTNVIINRIGELNKKSYKERINSVFSYYNISPPSTIVLDARNKIVHTGELPDEDVSQMDYWKEMDFKVSALLMALIGWENYFLSVGGYMCLDDIR